MIVFEEKFRELISLLPNLEVENGSFSIRYDWGTLDVLNKFLILPENVSKYPLIWLITGKIQRIILVKQLQESTLCNSNTFQRCGSIQSKRNTKQILKYSYSRLQ
jgi:hypothetical protein